MRLFRSLINFYNEVVAEFKRVTWPTRDATLQSTGVVLVVTITIALFLGAVDLGLSNAVRMIIG